MDQFDMLGLAILLVAVTTTLAFNPGMGGGPGMGGMGGPGMGGPGMGGMGGMGGMNSACARMNQRCGSMRCCKTLECKGFQGMRTCQPYRIGAGK